MRCTAYDDFEIIFNEDEQLYELFVEDSLVFKGSFSEVQEQLSDYFLNSPDWVAENQHDAEETARECCNVLCEDEDLHEYMLGDLADDLRDQTELMQLVLDFACDVLEIMGEAKKDLFGADPDVRRAIRVVAYQDIQEKIDEYADKLMEGEP